MKIVAREIGVSFFLSVIVGFMVLVLLLILVKEPSIIGTIK